MRYGHRFKTAVATTLVAVNFFINPSFVFSAHASEVPFVCTQSATVISSARIAKYIKPDKRPSTTAGMVIIKDGCILLAKERDPSKGDFSEFSGSGEKNGDGPETLEETAARETREETGMAYEMELLGNYDLPSDSKVKVYASCYQNKEAKKREVEIFFGIADQYKNPKDLLTFATDYAHSLNEESDKVEFQWVKITSLPTSKSLSDDPKAKYSVLTKDGKTIEMSFRPFFVEYLKSEPFTKTLNFMDELSFTKILNFMDEPSIKR